MAVLQNLSIKAKLIGAFAPVLAITVALGLFAVQRLAAVNDAAAEMRDHRLPAAIALGTMHAAVERLRANQNIMAGDITADIRKTVQGRADDQMKVFDDALAGYLPVVLPGDERVLSDALVAAWTNYKKQSGEFARLIGVDRDKGFNYLMVDMQTTVDQLRKAMQDDKEFNRQAGRKGAEYGAALAASARFWILGALLVTAALCITFALTMTQGFSKPIIALASAMRRLAQNDLSTEIVGVERRDEIGVMAQAVEVFKDSMVKAERLAADRQQEELAKERKVRALEELTRGFEAEAGALAGSLASEADAMRSTAESMSASTQQTHQQSEVVSGAAEQASANVETVAAATEELSSSILEISRQVADSAKFAGKAVEDAQRTDTTVQALADGAQRIGEVVTLIQDIASQTNLLALNATIEAARAGDAGKGFAVVAGEVKNLANQTAKATEDISNQIESIQRDTTAAVEAIRGIGQTIAHISQISSTVAAAVEQQGAATQEIARNVQQATQGTQQVTSNIAGVRQAAKASGTAAGQVLEAADALSQRAERLTTEVTRFIRSVREA